MRTDTTAVRFSEIAVIAQDLKSIFGIAIQLQPMIELIAPKSCFHAMFSTVIIDMVNAQKVPIINAATGTLAAISCYNGLPKSRAGLTIYFPNSLWVFSSPYFTISTIARLLFIIMPYIIGVVTLFLASCFFFGV